MHAMISKWVQPAERGRLAAFIWATRSGQFDDLSTPGVRVLFDEEAAPKPPGPQNHPEDGTNEA